MSGSVVVTVAAAVTALCGGVIALGGGPLLLGFDPDAEVGLFATSAAVTAWAMALVAVPISYRIAQRLYASKDL